MGTVTLAEDKKLGRLVALKRVHATADLHGLTRLRREALVGASLNHPNLVPVYDVLMEDDGDLTIVMQYVAGNTLRDLIRAGPIRPARDALRILEELASGLDVIHAQGIVHRDVKPANVLLGTDGAVKLADLGVAAVGERTQITTAGAVVGTFGYMAPEQLEGRKSDPAVDIYALSAVAFEMLSGHKARPEPNPLALAHAISTRPPPDLRDQWPEAPAEAAAVLQRGMAFDPRKRPRSASELVRRLGMALEPGTTEAVATVPREPPPPRAAHPAAREPAFVPVRRSAPSRRREPIARGAGGGGAARAGGSHGWPAAADRPQLTGQRQGPDEAWRRRMRNRRVGLVALFAVVIAAGALVAAFGIGGASNESRTAASRGAGAKAHQAQPSTRGRSSSSALSSAGQASASTPSSRATGPAASSGENGPVTAGASLSASGASASAATPTGAVESFYENAARHDYAAAWRLADSNLRNQLLGYSSFQSQMSTVRSITFHQAETLSGTSSSATVAVRTTSRRAGRTEQCAGTVRTLRSSAAPWLLDRVAVACSS